MLFLLKINNKNTYFATLIYIYIYIDTLCMLFDVWKINIKIHYLKL